ncbi:MAG TPA: carboxypeptidase-like regulatory domain-containing protein, partial [Candidatus Acidoferrales bacterium]|nr:carboxypeptidase-like regulatory domain-containing protein [Candidatus Acidoferrales bacterium]
FALCLAFASAGFSQEFRATISGAVTDPTSAAVAGAKVTITETQTGTKDLRSNGGTPMMLASLAMGVISTGQPATVQPYASAGAAGWSIGGMPIRPMSCGHGECRAEERKQCHARFAL